MLYTPLGCSFNCHRLFENKLLMLSIKKKIQLLFSTFFLVINCSALTPPANGAVSPRSCLTRSTYAQTCSFSCVTAGYVLEGTSARACGSDGKWSEKNDTLCKG